jgi:hypothetical protein
MTMKPNGTRVAMEILRSLLATLAVAVTAQPSVPADPDRPAGGTSY